jgi:hypothetical protein
LCRRHGIRREVEPGHLGAAPGQRQGVEAEMTLQMHQGLAADVTDFFALNRMQRVAAVAESLVR